MSAGWSPDELETMLDVRVRVNRLAADLELDGLTAAEIDRMPLSEFAALRRRAGLPDIPAPQVTPATRARDAAITQAPTGARTATTPGISADTAIQTQFPTHPDFGSMSLDDYRQIRDQYVRPGKGVGVGLFDAID